MSAAFYTDQELADLLGVSVSLIRKMAKNGPSRRGRHVLDIRLINCVVIGDMRRWNKSEADRLLGIN